MVLGWTLGIIYFVLLVVFGIFTFRKGHWVLGLIGFIFPILWIIGAILPSRYARRLRTSYSSETQQRERTILPLSDRRQAASLGGWWRCWAVACSASSG